MFCKQQWVSGIIKGVLHIMHFFALVECYILFTCPILRFYSSGLFTCRINPRPFPAKSNPEVSHAEINSLRGRPHHADRQPSHVGLDLVHDVLLLLGHEHIAEPKLVHHLICNLLQTAPQAIKLEDNCLPADVN